MKQAASFDLAPETLKGLAALAALSNCSQSHVIDSLVDDKLEELRAADAQTPKGTPDQGGSGGEDRVAQRWDESEQLYREAREWDIPQIESEIRARLQLIRPSGGEAWNLAQDVVQNALLNHLAFEIERRADPECAQALSELRTILEALHSSGRGDGAPKPEDLAHLGTMGGDVE